MQTMSYADRLQSALAEPDRLLLRGAAAIAARLNRPLYLVGGPVRDCLLGRPIVDFDLTVEGDAIELARSIARELGGTLKTHERFGTARLVLPGRSRMIDLAMTRTETYARPAALPDVLAGAIQDDMARRDFTLNAMAIRLDGDYFGELIDPYHGEADLQHGLIRVLHARSFIDDPTRLFRAARFEQRFGFTVDAATLNLIPPALPVLDQVSGDRLRHEFELIFREDHPERALARLHDWRVLRQIDRELIVDDQIRTKFQSRPAPAEPFACWVWLLGHCSPVALMHVTQRLNLLRDDVIDLEQVMALRDQQALIGNAPSASALYHQLDYFGDRALQAATAAIDDERARANIERYRRELREMKLSIDGTRLKMLGLPEGPEIGRILTQLRDAVLDGAVSGPQQEEAYARTLIAQVN